MCDSQLERLIGKALTTGALLKLKSVRRDSHGQVDTCVVHGREVCLSSADQLQLTRLRFPK